MGGLSMEKGILGTKIVTQIGFVVNDIEKTSQAFADFLGVEKGMNGWEECFCLVGQEGAMTNLFK